MYRITSFLKGPEESVYLCMYRLDRNAFKMHKFEEAANYVDYWLSKTEAERLRAAAYLNSVAWNYPLDNPPRMDKTLFRIRNRDHE